MQRYYTRINGVETYHRTSMDAVTDALSDRIREEGTVNCNCYVGRLGAEALFTLRHGAHNPSCPTYRVSKDPVDRANDEDTRKHFSAGRLPLTARLRPLAAPEP
jgi:hypothetical protein